MKHAALFMHSGVFAAAGDLQWPEPAVLYFICFTGHSARMASTNSSIRHSRGSELDAAGNGG
jgi:hypothetical protein